MHISSIKAAVMRYDDLISQTVGVLSLKEELTWAVRGLFLNAVGAVKEFYIKLLGKFRDATIGEFDNILVDVMSNPGIADHVKHLFEVSSNGHRALIKTEIEKQQEETVEFFQEPVLDSTTDSDRSYISAIMVYVYTGCQAITELRKTGNESPFARVAARLSIDVVELAKEHRKDISDKFHDGFIELSRLFEGLYKKRAPTEQEMQLRESIRKLIEQCKGRRDEIVRDVQNLKKNFGINQ
ncbi:hypothetical protein MBLNU230_g6456t1 [Neophaeotheca triangularis]